MELEEVYEIKRTADYMYNRSYKRVGLQFPDDLLKDSTKVVAALRKRLHSLYSDTNQKIQLFVMSDATYGSCCIDEVAAAHTNADCIVHYGHACLSPTSSIPSLVIFRKDEINLLSCSRSLCEFASTTSKTVVVLHDLEFSHAVPQLSELVSRSNGTTYPAWNSKIHFATVMSSELEPQPTYERSNILTGTDINLIVPHENETCESCRYEFCGLVWNLPNGLGMNDCVLFWIGTDDSAFQNAVMRFSSLEIVRYDPKKDSLVTDISQQKKILNRRYYLVEKTKDANIVGILVGTLGVAGYRSVIHQMKNLISAAGKKSYTFVMGRPNPAKLANFPECDVFIYVACPQTVLLNSKDYLAPVITPYEALLAFDRGRQWTGEYIMEFQHLLKFSTKSELKSKEARFSLIQGRYVEDSCPEEDESETEFLALQLRQECNTLAKNGGVMTGGQYLARRSYQGLEANCHESIPQVYVDGKFGRASGYDHETR